jgi:hypothetical protein
MFVPSLTSIKFIILIGYLFAIVIVIFFSWLYLFRTMRAGKLIGLHVHPYLSLAVRVSIVNALFTALLIGFFLLTAVY